MEFETIDVAKLETLNLALTNYFAHSLPNGKLYKNTINSLAVFLAPYISAVGGSGYIEILGNTLPTPTGEGPYFSIVSSGVYGDISADGVLNILSFVDGEWSLTKEIFFPIESTGYIADAAAPVNINFSNSTVTFGNGLCGVGPYFYGFSAGSTNFVGGGSGLCFLFYKKSDSKIYLFDFNNVNTAKTNDFIFLAELKDGQISSLVSLSKQYIAVNGKGYYFDTEEAAIMGVGYAINIDTIANTVTYSVGSSGNFIQKANDFKSINPGVVPITTESGYNGLMVIMYKISDGKIHGYNFTYFSQIDLRDHWLVGYVYENKQIVSLNTIRIDAMLLSNSLAEKNAKNKAAMQDKIKTRTPVKSYLIGTSITYGLGDGIQQAALPTVPSEFSRAQQTITQNLQTSIGQLQLIITAYNLGYPGDQTSDGLTRWNSYYETNGYPDHAVIEYAHNDVLATRAGTTPININTFYKNHYLIVENLINRGVYVDIMESPNILDASNNNLLSFYNISKKRLCEIIGGTWIETNSIINHLGNIWADGVHLKYQVYGAIGTSILQNYLIENSAKLKALVGERYYWYNKPIILAPNGSDATSGNNQAMFLDAGKSYVCFLNVTQICKLYVYIYPSTSDFYVSLDDPFSTTLNFNAPNTTNIIPQKVLLFDLTPGQRTIMFTKDNASYGWIDSIGFENL